MVAIAVLLVIGVTIGATLLFTRDGDGPSTPPTSDVPSDIASANDTGPVSIITEEPTCEAYTGINDAVANVQKNGWGDIRGSLGPSPEWTADDRRRTEEVVTVLRNSADQAVALAKQTPHRVVRELYEQFVAYARAYINSIPTYTPAADQLATANVAAGNALMAICNAVEFGSADRSLAVEPARPPTEVVPISDPGNPSLFMERANAICPEWLGVDTRFRADTAAWQAMDSSVDAARWTPEQRQTQLLALPRLQSLATEISSLGRDSGNAILEDFAETAALYLRAYVSTGDTYVAADSFLTATAFRIRNIVSAACESGPG
ncbi:hypothetical protein ACFQWH_13280 [Mycolicibacterium sp. GCM10028919]|uniref:hypothetical protein n=1 Tax=Mycolicibacterium sp. GCM10028919 TaxID=3273401 RepID=UPI00361F7262